MAVSSKFHFSPTASSSPVFKVRTSEQLQIHEKVKGRHTAVEPLAATRKEAAATLRISVASLDRLAKNGEIHPSRIGRSVRYPIAELRAYLERTMENQK